MLTTQEVRAIMRKHERVSIYTNKTRENCGNERTIKCYKPYDERVAKELIAELVAKAGINNVNFTASDAYGSGAGITVKCILK